MTKEEIIKSAKYIQFPYMNRDWKNYQSINNIHKLPILEDDGNVLYTNINKNKHHYTTYYHRTFALPLLNRLFDFGFSPDDFKTVPVSHNDSDFSYLVPKSDQDYFVEDFLTGEKGEFKYSDLCKVETDKDTIYHGLYKFAHSCSRIVNNKSKTDRILFISGDSQMIPSIMPLSVYFREVWYFDNRTGRKYDLETKSEKMIYERIHHISRNFKDTIFSDVLISLYTNPIDWYIDVNLK